MKIEKLLSKNYNPREQFSARTVIEDYSTNKTVTCNVPVKWSDTAANITYQKYAYRAQEEEKDFYNIFNRLASKWTAIGKDFGYFTNEEDAKNFYDEWMFLLTEQYASPNSPQWFNCGIEHQYEIKGDKCGFFYFEEDGEIKESPDSYTKISSSACYIQPVEDSLESITDLIKSEARLFRQGSGTGTNFSTLRAKNEKLSSGGYSSGVLSFLKPLDANAGSIKSGGTTRRAAKMVLLNVDHPEILDFVKWKDKEEYKVGYLLAGYKLFEKWWKIIQKNPDNWDLACSEIPKEIALKFKALSEQNQEPNLEEIVKRYDGSGYYTVDGQNSNNSVRVSNKFMESVINDSNWKIYNVKDGSLNCEVKARDLFNDIAVCAWSCADPGLQFDDQINKWNLCENDGYIVASNPCSEYFWLNNTACNLASINLIKCYDDDKHHNLDHAKFIHVIKLVTIMLDLIMNESQFPTSDIAEGVYNYRTIGLGYANLGSLIMKNLLSYESENARNLAAYITSLMTAVCINTSCKLAQELGSFPRFKYNKEKCLQCITELREISYGKFPNETLLDSIYEENIQLVSQGYLRNAQHTLIAPTGTIAFQMDCDSTGIEPEYSLIKTKLLSGGGSVELINKTLSEFYSDDKLESIHNYIRNKGTIKGYGLENEYIFYCANDISPENHLLMVAACQPFLSGGISKTINMPFDSTVEDIKNIYLLAYKKGVKCISVFRDKCKLSQPLNSVFEEQYKTRKLYNRSEKEELQNVSNASVTKVTINGHSLRIIESLYSDGRLGEIFLPVYKETSEVQSLFNAIAVLTSKCLQYGVPLEELVETFTNYGGVLSGFVSGHEKIKSCTSALDFIFSHLGKKYLDGESEKTHIDIKANKNSLEPKTVKVMGNKEKEICKECGGLSLVRTGSCRTCSRCGFNEGCG